MLAVHVAPLSETEYRAFVARVYEQFKQENSRRAIRATYELNLQYGDRVTWTARNRTWQGTVEGVNTKTVKVLAADGGRWKVAPTLLRKVTA